MNLSDLEKDKPMLMNTFKNFAKDEDGAVTVDWVVLTAAVVGLGLVVMLAIKPAISDLSTKIGQEIENAGDGLGGAAAPAAPANPPAGG